MFTHQFDTILGLLEDLDGLNPARDPSAVEVSLELVLRVRVLKDVVAAKIDELRGGAK